MNPEREDPILDSCLDEVLGGRQPPDLTARILAALAQGDRLPPACDLTSAPSALAQANGELVSLRRDSQSPKRRKSKSWQWLVIAASVGGLGIALGFAALQLSRLGVGDLAIKEQPREPKGQQRNVAKKPNTDRRSAPAQIVQDDGQGPKVVIPLDVLGSKGANDGQPSQHSDQPRYASQPVPDEELLSFVNAEIQRGWAEAGVRPASAATDSEWCRRTYVRLLGRIPTNEEVASFEDDKSDGKKQRLVDRLLGDEYADQFARHWASVWTNVLIGRTGGIAPDSLASREGLESYLTQSLKENKPYNSIVSELLTATGTNRPGDPDHNGAVNFLLAGLGNDATLATTRVSRVFLGQQLHCAQCHSHPSQEWSQHQYWALNSFLRQTEAMREGDIVRLAAADFVNKPGVTKDGEVYYQQSTGELKAAEPEFIDGTKVPPSGKLAEVDRRKELARLVTNSREMPRALVNRLWSHFFGYGFTSPIDDMGPHNQPSHPEVLDGLAGQFVAHDYDLKRAMRWMVLSDAFGRSSRPAGGGLADMPDSGKPPLFSRYYLRPMKAEEVYNSLLAAADVRLKSGNEAELAQGRRDFLDKLFRQRGNDDGEEESHEGGNVQSELMMNSRFIRRVVSSEQEGRLRTLIAKDSLPLRDKIEHLFLAALSRKPTDKEQEAIGKIMASAKDNQATALEDIWWALLNSNEFILDH